MCNLFAKHAQRGLPTMSLFSAVARSQSPCLANFLDIYERRLGGSLSIRAKRSSKSHYGRSGKQASVLDLKISDGERPQMHSTVVSTSCPVFSFILLFYSWSYVLQPQSLFLALQSSTVNKYVRSEIHTSRPCWSESQRDTISKTHTSYWGALVWL